MTPHARIGVLGGTFDPIHDGHLDVGAAAFRALGLERLLVMPSALPPHRPEPAASGYHRFAMVALAVAGRPGWEASDLELRAGLRSYTADTLRRLHGRGLAPTDLFFIAGADAFAEIGTWKDYPAVLDLAHFAIVSRPGLPVSALPARLGSLAPRMRNPEDGTPPGDATAIFLIDRPTSDVSSTAIRDARTRGSSIDGLVPDAVVRHIEQHALYLETRPSPRPGATATHAPADRLHGQD